ncbi:MAG: hypothetical protein IK066_07520 [Kiritimatiellae bacterium]|nr:hypothetical protein [Kiritimatiellia bacterium]
MGAGKAVGRAVVVAALLLCGCSGGREGTERATGCPLQDFDKRAEVRKEFVVLRELVKQHAVQSEAGNTERVETVERHLLERVEKLSDDGECEEERAIAFQARELVGKLGERTP